MSIQKKQNKKALLLYISNTNSFQITLITVLY